MYNITKDDMNGTVEVPDILVVTSLDLYNKSISDLTGIEAFTALKELYCDKNKLTSIDVSKNTELTVLECSFNLLQNLDVSNNTALEQLYLTQNKLSTLDVSKNTALIYLYCENNQLTTLDVSKNTALFYLYCENNQLTAIDVSNNTELGQIRCSNNQLKNLNLSKNKNLSVLYCPNNSLNFLLDLSKNTNLTAINVTGNADLQNIYVWKSPFPAGYVKDATQTFIKPIDTSANPTVTLNASMTGIGYYIFGNTGAIINVISSLSPASDDRKLKVEVANNLSIPNLPSGIQGFYSEKYWTLSNESISKDFDYDIILDLTDIPNITNFDSLKVLRQEGNADWENLSDVQGITVEYYNPYILITGLKKNYSLSTAFVIAFKTDNTMSIYNNEVLNKIKIYPNPSTTSFYVESPEKSYTLRMFNSLGQEVLTKEITPFAQQEINIEKLVPSLYLLQFSDKEGNRVNNYIMKN